MVKKKQTLKKLRVNARKRADDILKNNFDRDKIADIIAVQIEKLKPKDDEFIRNRTDKENLPELSPQNSIHVRKSCQRPTHRNRKRSKGPKCSEDVDFGKTEHFEHFESLLFYFGTKKRVNNLNASLHSVFLKFDGVVDLLKHFIQGSNGSKVAVDLSDCAIGDLKLVSQLLSHVHLDHLDLSRCGFQMKNLASLRRLGSTLTSLFLDTSHTVEKSLANNTGFSMYITDEYLKKLSKIQLPLLRKLSLNNQCKITNQGLQQVLINLKLKYLSVDNCSGISSKCFIKPNDFYLTFYISFEQLSLTNLAVSDPKDIVKILQTSKNCQWLNFYNCQVTDKSFEPWYVYNSSFGLNYNLKVKFLTKLCLRKCALLTGLSITIISHSCENLEELDMAYCPRVEPDGFANIVYLKKLVSLDISFCFSLNGSTNDQLWKSVKSLEYFDWKLRILKCCGNMFTNWPGILLESIKRIECEELFLPYTIPLFVSEVVVFRRSSLNDYLRAKTLNIVYPNLEILRLYSASKILSSWFIWNQTPNLKVLSIENNEFISKHLFLRKITKINLLKVLILTNCGFVDNEVLENIASICSSLNILDISNIKNLSKRTVRLLFWRLRDLLMLNIWGTNIDVADLLEKKNYRSMVLQVIDKPRIVCFCSYRKVYHQIVSIENSCQYNNSFNGPQGSFHCNCSKDTEFSFQGIAPISQNGTFLKRYLFRYQYFAKKLFLDRIVSIQCFIRSVYSKEKTKQVSIKQALAYELKRVKAVKLIKRRLVRNRKNNELRQRLRYFCCLAELKRVKPNLIMLATRHYSFVLKKNKLRYLQVYCRLRILISGLVQQFNMLKSKLQLKQKIFLALKEYVFQKPVHKRQGYYSARIIEFIFKKYFRKWKLERHEFYVSRNRYFARFFFLVDFALWNSSNQMKNIATADRFRLSKFFRPMRELLVFTRRAIESSAKSVYRKHLLLRYTHVLRTFTLVQKKAKENATVLKDKGKNRSVLLFWNKWRIEWMRHTLRTSYVSRMAKTYYSSCYETIIPELVYGIYYWREDLTSKELLQDTKKFDRVRKVFNKIKPMSILISHLTNALLRLTVIKWKGYISLFAKCLKMIWNFSVQVFSGYRVVAISDIILVQVRIEAVKMIILCYRNYIKRRKALEKEQKVLLYHVCNIQESIRNFLRMKRIVQKKRMIILENTERIMVEQEMLATEDREALQRRVTDNFATVIQNSWRRYIALLSFRQLFIEKESIAKLQRDQLKFRKRLEREAKLMEESLHSILVSILSRRIQRCYRRYRVRIYEFQVYHYQCEWYYATRIQAHVRRYLQFSRFHLNKRADIYSAQNRMLFVIQNYKKYAFIQKMNGIIGSFVQIVDTASPFRGCFGKVINSVYNYVGRSRESKKIVQFYVIKLAYTGKVIYITPNSGQHSRFVVLDTMNRKEKQGKKTFVVSSILGTKTKAFRNTIGRTINLRKRVIEVSSLPPTNHTVARIFTSLKTLDLNNIKISLSRDNLSKFVESLNVGVLLKKALFHELRMLGSRMKFNPLKENRLMICLNQQINFIRDIKSTGYLRISAYRLSLRPRNMTNRKPRRALLYFRQFWKKEVVQRMHKNFKIDISLLKSLNCIAIYSGEWSGFFPSGKGTAIFVQPGIALLSGSGGLDKEETASVENKFIFQNGFENNPLQWLNDIRNTFVLKIEKASREFKLMDILNTMRDMPRKLLSSLPFIDFHIEATRVPTAEYVPCKNLNVLQSMAFRSISGQLRRGKFLDSYVEIMFRDGNIYQGEYNRNVENEGDAFCVRIKQSFTYILSYLEKMKIILDSSILKMKDIMERKIDAYLRFELKDLMEVDEVILSEIISRKDIELLRIRNLRKIFVDYQQEREYCLDKCSKLSTKNFELVSNFGPMFNAELRRNGRLHGFFKIMNKIGEIDTHLFSYFDRENACFNPGSLAFSMSSTIECEYIGEIEGALPNGFGMLLIKSRKLVTTSETYIVVGSFQQGELIDFLVSDNEGNIHLSKNNVSLRASSDGSFELKQAIGDHLDFGISSSRQEYYCGTYLSNLRDSFKLRKRALYIDRVNNVYMFANFYQDYLHGDCYQVNHRLIHKRLVYKYGTIETTIHSHIDSFSTETFLTKFKTIQDYVSPFASMTANSLPYLAKGIDPINEKVLYHMKNICSLNVSMLDEANYHRFQNEIEKRRSEVLDMKHNEQDIFQELNELVSEQQIRSLEIETYEQELFSTREHLEKIVLNLQTQILKDMNHNSCNHKFSYAVADIFTFSKQKFSILKTTVSNSYSFKLPMKLLFKSFFIIMNLRNPSSLRFLLGSSISGASLEEITAGNYLLEQMKVEYFFSSSEENSAIDGYSAKYDIKLLSLLEEFSIFDWTSYPYLVQCLEAIEPLIFHHSLSTGYFEAIPQIENDLIVSIFKVTRTLFRYLQLASVIKDHYFDIIHSASVIRESLAGISKSRDFRESVTKKYDLVNLRRSGLALEVELLEQDIEYESNLKKLWFACTNVEERRRRKLELRTQEGTSIIQMPDFDLLAVKKLLDRLMVVCEEISLLELSDRLTVVKWLEKNEIASDRIRMGVCLGHSLCSDAVSPLHECTFRLINKEVDISMLTGRG